MISIASAVAYFARRMGVENVVIAGDGPLLGSLLPDTVRVTYSRISSALFESTTTIDARTLVAAVNLSAHVGGDSAAAQLNEWATEARAVLVWDDVVRLIDPMKGFRADATAPRYRPFGLDLGFSMYDARLPVAAPPPTTRRILPIIACYNEIDIIEACVESLVRDGCHPIVMDNWSTDGTFEALKPLAAAGKIDLLSYPSTGPVKDYEWRRLLAAKEEISAANPDAWIIHQDADEVRHGVFPDLSLAQNLQVVEDYGCNAIDYTVLNFRPIDNAWARGKDPEVHFTHFEMGESRDDYTRQIKAWLSDGRRPSLAEQAGHEVRFARRALYPYKFLLKHYPLRSDEHGRRKLKKDRMPRFSSVERNLGWHTHYDQMVEDETFLRDPADLIAFDPAGPDALGGSFATGLPRHHKADAEADSVAVSKPRVWLPAKALLVIDLPADATDAFAREILLDQLASTLKASFETVLAISMSPEGAAFAKSRGIPCEVLEINAFVESASPMGRAIALSKRLQQVEVDYVFGLAAGGALAASTTLKSQGLAFETVRFTALLGATAGLRLRDQGLDLHSPIHLEIDHLEWLTISRADECLAASSRVATEWLSRGVATEKIVIVPPRPAHAGRGADTSHRRLDQIVFLGPLCGVDFEAMTGVLKGLGETAPGLPVAFIGPIGIAFGEHAGGFLARGAAQWRVTLNIAPFPGLSAVVDRLKDENALVILPRWGGIEDVLSHVLAHSGIRCIRPGEAPSLDETPAGPVHYVPDVRDALRDLLVGTLNDGWLSQAAQPEPRQLGDGDLSFWENWASGLLGRYMTMPRFGPAPDQFPLVTVGIPHFDRAHHLIECIEGFRNQTYPNIEIIVVDDGSRKPENIQALRALQSMLEKIGGRVVHQNNAYLGAARNTAFREARGDYVLFFDDDDYPVPEMVERMMTAMRQRNADIVSTNISFWEGDALPSDFGAVKCSSAFLGDCPALAVYRNPFGSAAVLVKRHAFTALGQYTTDYGIGWEDYEFAARACLEGFIYENVPEPLYIYRVNYLGMAATTPTLANGRRVWRLLEKHKNSPRLAPVIRATFMERLWQEDKQSKFQWHHILGERTPHYHRLSSAPFNTRESAEHLCEVARIEGQPALAARLQATLLDGDWVTPLRSPQTAPAPRIFDGARALENALLLDRMGARQDAIAILHDALASPDLAGRHDVLIGLAYLHEREGMPERVAEYATQALREEGDDPEALFALSLAARAVSDGGTITAANRAFEACLARRLSRKYPVLAEHSPIRALEIWADDLAPQGVELARFKAFPNTFGEGIRDTYRGWESFDGQGAEFHVDMDAFGSWMADESTLFLHPSEPGRVALARIAMPQRADIEGISGAVQVTDTRAGRVEMAIFAENGQSGSLDELAARLADGGEVDDSLTFVPWTAIESGAAPHSIQGVLPSSVSMKALIVATRMASGVPNNWHALTYLRGIRRRRA